MKKTDFTGGALSDFALHANTFIGIVACFTDDFAADVKLVIDKVKEDPSSLDKYMRDEAPFPRPARVRFYRLCVRNSSSKA